LKEEEKFKEDEKMRKEVGLGRGRGYFSQSKDADYSSAAEYCDVW
jgi:hypothetical protein